MKRISLIVFALICALISTTSSYAQTLEEVTLTVSSDGPTKDEAVKNALRSAIEQAYGTFVSANTTILNDELVKDEIVTVSNGSIKDYKEISAIRTDKGNHLVTLTATVSLSNLITYAKSHGSECEFAGNAFDMEMKLFEFETKNEMIALENLLKQVEILIPQVMTWDLVMSEPIIEGDYYKMKADIYWRGTSDVDYETILSSAGLPKDVLDYNKKEIKKLKLSDKDKCRIEDVRNAKNRGRYVPDGTSGLLLFDSFQDTMKVDNSDERWPRGYHPFNEIDLLIYNTLSNILTSDYETMLTWEKRGVDIGVATVVNCGDVGYGGYSAVRCVPETFFFRSEENSKVFKNKLDSLITNAAINFVIKDNTGQVSSPNWFEARGGRGKGTGLLSPQYEYYLRIGYNNVRSVHPYDARGSDNPFVRLTFKIPKNEIGKYSKFWVEPKQ